MAKLKSVKVAADEFYQQAAVQDLTWDGGEDSTTDKKFASSSTILDLICLVVKEAQFSIAPVFGATATWGELMTAMNIIVRVGLSWLANPPISGFRPGNAGYYCHEDIAMVFGGVPASNNLINPATVTIRFDHLPGGGLIVHPANLYAWGSVLGGALTADIYLDCVIRFIYKEIDMDTWQQLFQIQAVQGVI